MEAAGNPTAFNLSYSASRCARLLLLQQFRPLSFTVGRPWGFLSDSHSFPCQIEATCKRQNPSSHKQVQPRSALIAWPSVRRKTAIQAGYPKSILFPSLCFFKRTEQIEKIQLFFKRHTDRCAETMMP